MTIYIHALHSVIFVFCFIWSISSQDCVSNCFLRREEFGECMQETVANDTTKFVHITLATLNTTELEHEELLLERIANDITYILAFICQENDVILEINQPPPYCYIITEEREIDCPSRCEQLNCSRVSLYIEDLLRKRALNPSTVISILEDESAVVALRLAGVLILEASSDQQDTERGRILDDVPIVSWIFIVVGIIVSTLILLKPLWWDKCLKRIKFSRHKKDTTTDKTN